MPKKDRRPLRSLERAAASESASFPVYRSTGPPVHRSTGPPVHVHPSTPSGRGTLEIRVRLLVVRHREVHVRPVVRSLEERTDGEHLVLRASVLTHQPRGRRTAAGRGRTSRMPSRGRTASRRRVLRRRRRRERAPSRQSLRFADLLRARAQRVEDRHHPRDSRSRCSFASASINRASMPETNGTGSVRCAKVLADQPRRAVEARPSVGVRRRPRADRRQTRTATRSSHTPAGDRRCRRPCTAPG